MSKMVVHEEGAVVLNEGVGDGEKYFADYVGALIIKILWDLVADHFVKTSHFEHIRSMYYQQFFD